MPVSGIAEFWQVQEKIDLRQSCIHTNQIKFIDKATCDTGYKIYLHKDGRAVYVHPQHVDAVRKHLAEKE